jgi:hypothetical protein
MIRTIFLISLASLAWAQSTESKQPPAATRPVPKAPPVKRHPDGRPLGVPFSATKIADGAWRAIENGKPVIYRSTAFGFAKVSEEENAKIQRMIDGKPDSEDKAPEGVSVVEKDGQLHFSRITPFGDYKWTRSKNELNAMEAAVWRKFQAQATKGDTKN